MNRLIAFPGAWIALLVACTSPEWVSAQEPSMHADGYMLDGFSDQRRSGASRESWSSFNPDRFRNHPEYGMEPSAAVAAGYVEDLARRTADSRYFLDPSSPGRFIVQRALGDLHYLKDGFWVSINPHLRPAGEGVFAAPDQPWPTLVDCRRGFTALIEEGDTTFFNRWVMMATGPEGTQEVAEADWTDYTAGDDGVRVRNFFPGVDAEFIFFQGSIKTNFIIRELPDGPFTNWIFSDQFGDEGSGEGSLLFVETGTAGEGRGEVGYWEAGEMVAEVGGAVWYSSHAEGEVRQADYVLDGRQLRIVLPDSSLREWLELGPVVLDPLVSSSNFLSQAAVNGSRYNASCLFDTSCDYNLTVNTPAAATITNILWDFNYIATGACVMDDGALRLTLGSCVSPAQAGFFWRCNLPSPGTCFGTSIPIFNDLSPCLPPPSCAPQPLNFSLRFFRSCWGNAGCDGNCIGAGSPWTMTVQGYTVEFSNLAPNQVSLSASTVCAGQPVVATSLGDQFGVPPYQYSWSLNASGAPVLATGSPATFTIPSAGTYTVYGILTDQCGNTVTATRTLTVTPAPAPPSVVSPVAYCQGAPANPLSAGGTSLLWYLAPSGGAPVATPTPSTAAPGSTTYYVSQTVNGCESARSALQVIVHPLPQIQGAPGITPTACNAPTGSISGLSASGSSPFTLQWTNALGTVVATSSTAAGLTGQPQGSYTLQVTDANGCSASLGPFSIGQYSIPDPPVVQSPVSYCQGQAATPLSAQGNSLGWYQAASGGLPAAAPFVPDTGSPGTQVYYVSQTVNGCESARAPIQVNVLPQPQAPGVSSPVLYCLGDAALPLEATGAVLQWYAQASGGVPLPAAPVPDTSQPGVSVFYVSQTIGGCESQRSGITAIVNSPPEVVGSPVAVPSACGNPTGSITGLLVTGSGGLNYTWVDVNGLAVSTSVQGADLAGQPAGFYSLQVTDGLGCGTSFGPVEIGQTGVDAPAVSTPVNYCEGDFASPLEAEGLGLSWSLAGGAQQAVAPVPSTLSPGQSVYEVTQTINGCTSEPAEILVIVSALPDSPVVLSPVTYCQSQAALPLEAVGAGLTWQGPSGSSSQAPVPDTDVPGTYVFDVTSTLNGCEGPASSIEVIIHPLPEISGNPQIAPASCGQEDGSIQGLVAQGAAPFDMTWTGANGVVVDAGPGLAGIDGLAPGAYSVSIEDENGCMVDGGPYEVPGFPEPPPPATGGAIQLCVGQPGETPSATGSGLLWYEEPGGQGSGTPPFISSVQPFSGNLYVTQTVSGCESDPAVIPVLVAANPQVSISGGPQAGCTPLCASFTSDIVPGDGTVTSVSWSAGGLTQELSGAFVPCFSQPGVYAVQVAVSDEYGCTAVDVLDSAMVAWNTPSAGFTFSPAEVSELDPLVTFQVTAADPSNAYQWDFGDGASSAGQVVEHEYANPGQYCIFLEVTGPEGCTAANEECLSVKPELMVYAPNAFTPDGDGVNDYWLPECSGISGYELWIFSRWGEVVFHSTDQTEPWTGSSGGSFAPDGVYHFRLVVGNSLRTRFEYSGHIVLVR